jgi:hypothetical protein
MRSVNLRWFRLRIYAGFSPDTRESNPDRFEKIDAVNSRSVRNLASRASYWTSAGFACSVFWL